MIEGAGGKLLNPTRSYLHAIIIAFLSLAVGLTRGNSQQPAAPKASQPGSVMQQVAGTKITIVYNRPVARGRELFGKLVPYGKAWNPGADEATNITLSTPVKINGRQLAAGSYTIWAIPAA